MSDNTNRCLERIDTHMESVLERLLRMESRIDSMSERMSDLVATASIHNASLEEHMRRTELLEKSQDSLSSRVTPLEKSETRWALMAKAFAVLAGSGGVFAALTRLLG